MILTAMLLSGAIAGLVGMTEVMDNGLFPSNPIKGLGFAGIVPNYILAARALFPSAEASWRIPIMMFGGLLGMAVGGWMGGLIYDATGSYAPSFAVGVLANLANLVVIGFLVARDRKPRFSSLVPA